MHGTTAKCPTANCPTDQSGLIVSFNDAVLGTVDLLDTIILLREQSLRVQM